MAAKPTVSSARAGGGDLLALNDAVEESFIVSAFCDRVVYDPVSTEHVYGWIGYTGSGTWSNGEPEDYIHWAPPVRVATDRTSDCGVSTAVSVDGTTWAEPTGAIRPARTPSTT